MARDSERTKRLLLEAAHAEFAEYGVAGARVDRIAANAGCNKERIYGHFGNKEALFDAVLTAAIAQLATAVQPANGEVADYVGRVFDYHHSDPSLLRLLMFEALHHRDGLVDGNAHRRDWYASVRTTFAEQAGMTEKDAGRTLLTLIGIGAWSTAMPQLTRLFLGDDAGDENEVAELRDFLTSFAERAVESR